MLQAPDGDIAMAAHAALYAKQSIGKCVMVQLARQEQAR